MAMEQAMAGRTDLVKKLGFPSKIKKVIPKIDNYSREKHIRLMRFDFHPTTEGWSVSEVNSDVPGGLAEASVLPRIAHFKKGPSQEQGLPLSMPPPTRMTVRSCSF